MENPRRVPVTRRIPGTAVALWLTLAASTAAFAGDDTGTTTETKSEIKKTGDVAAAPAAAVSAVAAAAAAKPAVAPAPPADPAVVAAQRAAALRKKVLKDDDFVENDDVNRDPFHSYLRLFVDKGTIKTRKVPALFDKLDIDELALIAIVTGDSDPRAMFRDPAGLGETIKKGDYISKSGARVTKILSDRVVVELMETNAKGEPHAIEKAILVNPDEGDR